MSRLIRWPSRPSWLTREVWGWALFDFANQSFTIVILTAMFQIYFVEQVVPGGEVAGRRWWSLCGMITQAVLAITGPLIGALADFSGTKKRLLFASYVGACLFSLSLAFVQPGQAVLGASLFVLAYLFYGVGENLLSAFLPELATHRDMGRVSAFSWTIAYVGALLALLGANALIALVPGAQMDVIVGPVSEGAEPVVRNQTTPLGFQISSAFAAIFFTVAGLFLFLWVPERHYPQAMPAGQTMWTIGFHRTWQTLGHVRRFRQLFRFLAIMTFFFAGMQAIYWFGATVARELFKLSDDQTVAFIMLATLIGIPGAALVGPIQDRLGSRNTLMGLLAFWGAVVLFAAAAGAAGESWRWAAWPVACLVGLGIGGLGTAARATVGLFSPPQRAAEFFGFYGIAHKISAMLGLGWMAALDWLTDGRYTIVVASLAIFFVGGVLLLFLVDEKAGRIAALRAAKEGEREQAAGRASSVRADHALAAAGSHLPSRHRPSGDPPAPDRTDLAGSGHEASGQLPSAAHAAAVDAGADTADTADTAGAASRLSAPTPRAAPSVDSISERSARTIYLDNNATTRPAPEVVEAMRTCLATTWHNPSSVHRPGQAARHAVELARQSVARLIGASEREIIFTSGGTESANLAIVGSLELAVARDPRRRVVVTSRLEHSAVRELAERLAESGRAEVVWLEHDPMGIVDLGAFDRLLESRAAEIALVSLMWANNETGVVQPIVEVGLRCRERGVRLHCDATQWVGRMPTDVDELPVDLLTFSGHKFHGPKGIGVLWIRRGVRVARQMVGGPQEHERRGGTENVPGIVGMGAAAELARAWLAGPQREHLAECRNRLEQGILAAVPDAVINGADAPRLWNTSNIGFPRLEAEAILLVLSERGLCASAGAACSSGSLDPSPVLLAMGIAPEVAHGSVRFSLSRETTDEEIEQAIDVVVAAVGRLRRSSDRVV